MTVFRQSLLPVLACVVLLAGGCSRTDQDKSYAQPHAQASSSCTATMCQVRD